MQVLMMAIGDEGLNMDKANSGIRMEFYNMKESGNVGNHMVMGEYTINGVN